MQNFASVTGKISKTTKKEIRLIPDSFGDLPCVWGKDDHWSTIDQWSSFPQTQGRSPNESGIKRISFLSYLKHNTSRKKWKQKKHCLGSSFSPVGSSGFSPEGLNRAREAWVGEYRGDKKNIP